MTVDWLFFLYLLYLACNIIMATADTAGCDPKVVDCINQLRTMVGNINPCDIKGNCHSARAACQVLTEGCAADRLFLCTFTLKKSQEELLCGFSNNIKEKPKAEEIQEEGQGPNGEEEDPMGGTAQEGCEGERREEALKLLDSELEEQKRVAAKKLELDLGIEERNARRLIQARVQQEEREAKEELEREMEELRRIKTRNLDSEIANKNRSAQKNLEEKERAAADRLHLQMAEREKEAMGKMKERLREWKEAAKEKAHARWEKEKREKMEALDNELDERRKELGCLGGGNGTKTGMQVEDSLGMEEVDDLEDLYNNWGLDNMEDKGGTSTLEVVLGAVSVVLFLLCLAFLFWCVKRCLYRRFSAPGPYPHPKAGCSWACGCLGHLRVTLQQHRLRAHLVGLHALLLADPAHAAYLKARFPLLLLEVCDLLSAGMGRMEGLRDRGRAIDMHQLPGSHEDLPPGRVSGLVNENFDAVSVV